MWLAMPLAVGAAALTVWLYLPDVRSLGRAQGITLLVLRAAAVVLMALVLLQPVLRFVHTGREKRALVFFLDTSESMSVADTGIRPARVEQLIEGLKLRDKAASKGLGRARLPQLARNLRARAGEVRGALEALAAPGEEIAEWRAGLESVRGPAAALSQALAELDTARVPASDRAALEAAAFVDDEFGRFRIEEGETESQVAGRLKWLAQDCLPAARKLTEQIGWLERALERRTREDAVSSEARARGLATESTRFELAIRALTSRKLGVVERLAETHEISAFALSGAAERFDLVREGEPVGLKEMELELAPTGKATDLAGSVLAGVNELAAAYGSRIAGVVILSDGRQTEKGSPLDAAAALGARGIPVYAVGVGSGGRPRDAAIVELRAPESVFKGDKIEIEVVLAMPGIPEEQVRVALAEEGRTPYHEYNKVKTVAIENATGRATFEVPAEVPGIRRFTLSIPEFELESTLDNNSREVIVKVVEDKLRVTVVFEYPRWELRFLRNLIWRDRKMELDVVSYVERPRERRLGRTREEIMKSSVIVLDDVAGERFSAEDRRNLAEFVSRRGGTMIMIAGPDHLPSEYLSAGQAGTAGPPLADLVPFKAGARPAWRVRDPGERPFTLALTPEGRAEPFMRLAEAGAGEDAGDLWAGLPGFFEYVAAGGVAPGTKVLLKVRETGDPLLMVRRYGLGEVIFLAMHETWRWRYKVADRDHGRFWGDLLRYAGEEPFAVKDRFVSLDTDRTIYSPGEPVNVRARVLGADGLPLVEPEGAKALKDLVCVFERKLDEGEEVDADGPRRVIRRPLEARAGGGGIYRATFGSLSSDGDKLPAGDYTVSVESPRLSALYGAGRGAVTLEISVRPGAEEEFVDTSFCEETLAGMARASFGRYFDISQIGELPEAVAGGRQERTTVTRVELWSSYYVYALVLALLSAEWILRKRLGLA